MNARTEPPTARGRGRSSFGADRLARIAQLESSHFWFAGRRALVQRLLDRHVARPAAAALDVGCGTGSFLPILGRYADRVVGIEPLGGNPGAGIVAGEAERLPFEEDSFDLIVALDVLEHVNDRAAVGELARVLRPGGWAVITVPAFPRLWSERDELMFPSATNRTCARPLAGLERSAPSHSDRVVPDEDAPSMEQVIDLATRKSGSIAVALIWDRPEQALRVIAYDGLTHEEIVLPVSGEEAAEVYRHPFAYASRAIKPADGGGPSRPRR